MKQDVRASVVDVHVNSSILSGEAYQRDRHHDKPGKPPINERPCFFIIAMQTRVHALARW